MKQRFLLLCFALWMATVAYAQHTVPRWSLHEITLASVRNSSNPYIETGVTAIFHGPGGVSKKVLGFWDGSNTFKIRFTPTIQGRWSWSTTSADEGLNRRSGVLECTLPQAGKHGFLRRDSTHRYSFVWDDGSRYFMWGQTYYDAMLNVMANGGWKAGVDNSAVHGMNKIRLHIYAQQDYKEEERTTYPQVIPYGGTYSNQNRDQLNISYWQGLDGYVKYLENKGIIADLIVFNPYGKNIMWGTQAQDERYLRYILARYAAFPNVIWCIANEWNYSNKPQAFFDAMGTIVRNEDPWMTEGAQLRALSIHQGTRIDFNYFKANWPVHAIVQYGVRNKEQGAGNEPNKTGATRYRNGDEWGNASILYNLGHHMPVVNDEYGYLGELEPVQLTQAQHRAAMWGVATAGGYGAVGDYRMKSTGNPEISGDWADAPEYDDIRRLVDFFSTKGLEYWKMSSQNSLVSSGTRIYVLAEVGRQYLIYSAVGGTFDVRIASGTYDARLYNPRTGEDSPLRKVSGAGSRSFTMPDANDWVVYLKANAAR